MASLGHTCKFQHLSRLGSVTARHTSSGRQPDFAVLDRGRHLYLDLCNGIVKEGCIPEDWKSGVILPIYKGKVIQWSVDLIGGLNCWNML